MDDPDSFVFCNPALRHTRKVDSINSLNSADLDFYDRSSPPAQQYRIRTSGSASDLKLEHRYSPRSAALRSAPQTPTRKWIPPMKMSIRTTVTPATPETGRRRSSPDSRTVAAAAALRKVTHINDLRADSTEDILTATTTSATGSESGGTTSPALSPRSSTGEIEALPRVTATARSDANGILSFPWQNKEQLKEWGLQAGDIELLEQETLV